MGCNSSKGPRQEQSRAPRLQPPAGRPAAPAQSLTRVKLVLLGATGVGKSCLVLRYVKGLFEAASRVTVGAAFLAHSVALPDGRTVKFEIWDTAGQERYASLAPLYYRGAGAAVVMYDITSAETFTKAKYWVTELQKNAPGNLVIVLAGNKSDLAEHRQVTTEEGEAYAASNSMMFLETSAKTAANVATVFDVIARTLGGAGAPPSGPSVRTAPPSAATHSPSKQPTHRSQQSSTPQKPPQDPSTASATLPADARRPQHAQSGKGLQDSTESLASNQSAASMASDGAGEPLPPSSDAAVLDAPSLSSKPSSTPRASIHNAAPSGTQPSKEVHAPTTPAPAQGHSSAKNGTASEAAKAQGDLLGTDDATGGDGEMDLPAAPRKAEPKAEVEEAADAAHESTALPHDAAPRKAERKAEVDKAADDAHESAAPTNDAAGQQQGSVTAAGSNPSKPLDDQAPKEQGAAKLKPSDAAAKDDRAEAADKGAEDSQDRAQ